MAGVIVLMTGQFTEQDTTDRPQITFIQHEGDRRLTVADIDWLGGPLYWSNDTGAENIVVAGCLTVNGQPLNGSVPLRIGDELVCQSGMVTMVFAAEDYTIHATRFA